MGLDYFEDATLKFELAASLNATLVVPGNGCSGIFHFQVKGQGKFGFCVDLAKIRPRIFCGDIGDC